MSESPVNFHRSFAALLVGNIIALFVSGLVCILIGHATHAEFFESLRQFKLEQKALKKEAEQKQEASDKPDQGKEKANSDDAQKEKEPKPDQDSKAKKELKGDQKQAKGAEPDKLKRPEFPFGFLAITLFTNVLFAGIAGYVCVWIAGFAHHHHGMLMALFIVVWKVQQLLRFVENQVPATLLTIELIALPVACIVGASLAADSSAVEDEV